MPQPEAKGECHPGVQWMRLTKERGVLKVRAVIRELERDGWYLVQTHGSFMQYKHPNKPGRVTIAGHPNDGLAPGTLNSIRKPAGRKGEKQ